jgi:uncharacterized membrane protein YbhN (UPF0104 family)
MSPSPQTLAATEAAAPPPAEQGRRRTWLRAGAAVAGVALFVWTMRDLDGARLHVLLRAVGLAGLLLLLPQALGSLLHAAAWRQLLAALGSRVPLFALTRVFLGSEGARMAMPAGAAVGESVAAWQVKARFGVSWTRGLASLAAKKAWVLCTHALCLVLLFVLGGAALDRLAQNLPAGGWLRAILWGMTVALAVSGGLTLALLGSRRAAVAIANLAARLPFERARHWAATRARDPEAKAAATIPPLAHASSALLLFGQWLTEFAETWLLLHLLGVPVTVTEALAIELGGSLVRAAAFVVPGGLGVTDASYVGMLGALGIPGATEVGAAFVLLKRAKEVVFIAVGLGALARTPTFPVILPTPAGERP